MKHACTSLFLVILLLLTPLSILTPPVVLATTAPTITAISGTLQHNASMTITGSSFGTKTQAAPLKYDGFENGSPGAFLQGWALETNLPNHQPQYSNTKTRLNSAMSARANFTGGNYLSTFGVLAPQLPKVYFDAWYYYDAVSPYSRNHKLFRIESNDYKPNLYYNLYCPTHMSGSRIGQDQDSWGNVPTTSYTEPVSGWGSANFAGRWMHIQGYFEESSPTADTGTAKLWIDETLVANRVGNWRTRTSSATYWNKIRFGNYLSHDSDNYCSSYGDANAYWDNVYVDTTQARVEIGNAATYNTSTHREIQIPQTWSDTSITFTVNQGAFANLQGLYLYVVDTNGNVNAQGFPLTDTTAPTVSITSPTTGTTVTGSIVVTANASDNVGVVGVQFKLDGANLGSEDTTAPYSVDWNTTTASNGLHTLTAVARDAAGNTTTSAVVNVNVNNRTLSTLISEDFSTSAANFTVIAGGTWSVSNGKYMLTNPASATPHGNVSLHNTSISGDFTLVADASVVATADTWNDFSIIFNYQDASHYYFVSFNERNDGGTSGIFKYDGGILTELADITATITPDTTYTIKVEKQGDSITVYRDGVLVASRTEPNLSGGKVGFGSRNDAATFDNLVVTDSSNPTIISEDFSTSAANFTVIAGGTWNVNSGQYQLTNPASASPHGNLSIHNTTVPNSFTLTIDASVIATADTWNDFSIIFNYQDATHYYFASFNERNDGGTSGIFKYDGGILTELTDIIATITAGTTYSIEIERTSSTINVYRDGLLVASRDDSSFSGGKVGVGSRNDAANFDNLVVTR